MSKRSTAPAAKTPAAAPAKKAPAKKAPAVKKAPQPKRPPSSGKRVENAAAAAEALIAEAEALVGDADLTEEQQRQFDAVEEAAGQVVDRVDELDDCEDADERGELAEQAEEDLGNARAEFEDLKRVLRGESLTPPETDAERAKRIERDALIAMFMADPAFCADPWAAYEREEDAERQLRLAGATREAKDAAWRRRDAAGQAAWRIAPPK